MVPGFPADICAHMNAWLNTHVAKILATRGKLFYAGRQIEQLATNPEALMNFPETRQRQ